MSDKGVHRAILRAPNHRLLDAIYRRNYNKGRHVVGSPRGEREL
jgi:hypothetical protein